MNPTNDPQPLKPRNEYYSKVPWITQTLFLVCALTNIIILDIGLKEERTKTNSILRKSILL